jgi:hypothetical protein
MTIKTKKDLIAATTNFKKSLNELYNESFVADKVFSINCENLLKMSDSLHLYTRGYLNGVELRLTHTDMLLQNLFSLKKELANNKDLNPGDKFSDELYTLTQKAYRSACLMVDELLCHPADHYLNKGDYEYQYIKLLNEAVTDIKNLFKNPLNHHNISSLNKTIVNMKNEVTNKQAIAFLGTLTMVLSVAAMAFASLCFYTMPVNAVVPFFLVMAVPTSLLGLVAGAVVLGCNLERLSWDKSLKADAAKLTSHAEAAAKKEAIHASQNNSAFWARETKGMVVSLNNELTGPAPTAPAPN